MAGGDSADIIAERDFFRRLLDLGRADEAGPLLDQALALIVDATGAQTAYLELGDREWPDAPPLWKAHGCDDADVESIRATISRSIVGRARAEGRTVATWSAVDDPAFSSADSVLKHRIRATLCAPVGDPPIGVVYLQAREASERFATRNRDHVEVFARHLAPLADRLLARLPRDDAFDHTREIRTRFRCDQLHGRSAALARVLREAAQVAPLNLGVLISGPVGTGKSALARAIAASSPRATGVFLALNCAAIPESLVESELFGHVKGAFSGATEAALGKVGAARGGTLFLDEIGELPLPAQAKLLQLLQERQYFPVGATRPVVADVRVISATNVDLKARVARKQFRDDLYFRLNVVPIAMPGLDERRDDIPELVERFCQQACAHHGVPPLRVSRRALLACREAPWPGHVRELANAVEAAVARATFEQARVLLAHHVFPLEAPAGDAAPTYREATQRFQHRLVVEALERNNWNITRAAAELDIARQHLHDLIKAFGLERPESRD